MEQREILFRGKSISGDYWVYGLLSISQGREGQPERGYYISNKAGMPWAYSVRPETVGQYTGQTDRLGGTIFEGAILLVLKHTDLGAEDNKKKQFKMVVEWNKHSAGFDLQDLEDCGDYLEYDGSWSIHEIIGNIHEPDSKR